ncbi:nucleoside phosphorylase [Facklamia hominis]|uniref:nucleoside phosphorylase n=1 Tax=Facklamia hominis TaxID=178214 RepID=UPI000C7E7DE0|nr:nucleoside phosphorylase [Facklamia hominis]PKY92744.1 phosphorylase [Facklamia hominis]
MAIQKNDFPILEFDNNPKAVIMPDHERLGLELPKKCVYAFLGEYIDEFAKENKANKVAEFDSITKIFPIYEIQYKNETVCIVQAPMGSAPATQLLDWLISYGVKEIISTGTCGSLVDLPENTFLVPKVALRDEGTSYHYLPAARYIEIDGRALDAIEKTLNEHGLKYKEIMTWTTDGFYRETKDFVAYRIEEGCSVVEMECSALAACAKLRKVIWGQILFTADSLTDVEKYNTRNWGGDSFEYSLTLALDAVINIERCN